MPSIDAGFPSPIVTLPVPMQVPGAPPGVTRLEMQKIDIREWTSKKIELTFSLPTVLSVIKESAWSYYEWALAACHLMEGTFRQIDLVHKEDLAIGAQPAGPIDWLPNIAAQANFPSALDSFFAVGGTIPQGDRAFVLGFGFEIDPNNNDDHEAILEHGRGNGLINGVEVFRFIHAAQPSGAGNPAANSNGWPDTRNFRFFTDPDGHRLALALPVNKQWNFQHGFNPAVLTRATYIRYTLRTLYVRDAKNPGGSTN